MTSNQPPVGPNFGVPGSTDINRLHDYDDIDQSILAHHHSLGIFPAQASPGDHIHDGRFSKRFSIINHTDYGHGLYAPTPSGGVVSLGNGTAVGRYQRIGKIVHIQTKITFGSTTTYAAGQPISVPLPSPLFVQPTARDTLMLARLLDSSAGQSYWGGALIDPSQDLTATFRISFGAPGGSMTPTVPITLAVSDVLHVTGFYETDA